MPAVKRKASTPMWTWWSEPPSEPPSKLAKRTTSSTLSRKGSTTSKTSSKLTKRTSSTASLSRKASTVSKPSSKMTKRTSSTASLSRKASTVSKPTSKLTKRTSSTASLSRKASKVSKPSSKMTKRTSSTASLSRKASTVSKPSRTRSHKALTKEATVVTASREDLPAVFRREPTLPLEEPQSMLSTEVSTSARSLSKGAEDLAKSASFVDEGTLTTKLSGLKSGSLIGETSMADSLSFNKKLNVITLKTRSKKSFQANSKVPSWSSGLTKFALSKAKSISSIHLSKSVPIECIDESEISSALTSLRPYVSEEKSTTADVEIPPVEEDATKPSTGPHIRRCSRESPVYHSEEEEEGEEEEGYSEEEEGPGDGAMPPGGILEVAISFDTTGSMYECLTEVRSKIQDMVQRLQADIPGIRIAVIAHGDYCDAAKYVVKWIDFGASVPELCDFVNNVERTHGGDGPKCYELMMNRACGVLSWTPKSHRVLIMIGDSIPHPPGYTYEGKTYYINWRQECVALKELGVKLYAVQYGVDPYSTWFNKEMVMLIKGKRQGSHHLRLCNFSSICHFLMMICYREGNPDMMSKYEEEQARPMTGGMSLADFAELKQVFKTDDTKPALNFGFGGATKLGFGGALFGRQNCFPSAAEPPCAGSTVSHADGRTLLIPIGMPTYAGNMLLTADERAVPRGKPVSDFEEYQRVHQALNFAPLGLSGRSLGSTEPSTAGMRFDPPSYAGIPSGSLLPSGMPSGSLFPNGIPSGSLFPGGMSSGSLLPSGMSSGSLLPSEMPSGSLLPSGMPSGLLFPSGMYPGAPIFPGTRFGTPFTAGMPFGAPLSTEKPKVSSPPGHTEQQKKWLAKKGIGLCKRENWAPDASISNLTWTKWMRAIVPSHDLPKRKTAAAKFTPCRANTAYKLRSIFDEDTRTPAVYELAVVLGGRGKSRKKRVVYYKKSTGYQGYWDQYLLRDKLVKQEVDNVLKAGCSIWIRRGVAKGADAKKIVETATKYIDSQYDYAWKKYCWRKTGHDMKHRRLAVPKSGPNSVVLSNDTL